MNKKILTKKNSLTKFLVFAGIGLEAFFLILFGFYLSEKLQEHFSVDLSLPVLFLMLFLWFYHIYYLLKKIMILTYLSSFLILCFLFLFFSFSFYPFLFGFILSLFYLSFFKIFLKNTYFLFFLIFLKTLLLIFLCFFFLYQREYIKDFLLGFSFLFLKLFFQFIFFLLRKNKIF